MNYSNKELRALAREKKVKYYYVKSKEELCEALGIEHEPRALRKITPVTIRCVEKDETTHFPSISALAKAMGKNIGSVVWYEKTKRPISVVVPEGVIPPGKYIIDRVTK